MGEQTRVCDRPVLIDVEQLSRVYAMRTCEEDELLEHLIERYAIEAESLLSSLDNAARSHDAAALFRCAHQLKSNSATVGACYLAELSQLLEEDAATGVTRDTRRIVDAVVSHFPPTITALTAHCRRLRHSQES